MRGVHEAPRLPAELGAQLALAPANSGVGGVVEAFGRQAKELGQEQAAAIAFSSSQELIDANLPTSADQRAAFEDVTAHLQRAFFSIAAGNAVRLSANGSGWSDSEVRDFVQGLGPSLAGEVASRTRNTPGDSAPGGAVEALGLAAREISRGDVSDEDREEWELNSAVALTASPELIDAHLNGTEALQAVAQEILEAALPEGDVEAARAEPEALFRQMLEEQGPGADLGQVLKEVQEAHYRRLQDAIGNQLQRGDLTQAQRNQLEAASLVIGNIQEGFDNRSSPHRQHASVLPLPGPLGAHRLVDG